MEKSSVDKAWEQHFQLQDLTDVKDKAQFLLFGWEGFKKTGDGFRNIIGEFKTVEQLTGFVNSPYMAQVSINTLQAIDMKTLKVVRRFERQRKNEKWSRVV